MTEYFVHSNGLCETAKVGRGTRIWAFAHVLEGATIGADCNICDHVFIEGDVIVGDRVTIKCGVQLWNGLRVEDDVFVGPNASFSNDKHPRSKRRPERYATTILKRGCSIGANATVLPGVTVGVNAMVGAGAVVIRDVPPNAIVAGNPASVRGYVDSAKSEFEAVKTGVSSEAIGSVVGARAIHLQEYRDARGSLFPAESHRDLPFVPRRIFVIRDVPGRDVRGEHAHRELEQFLLCVAGECSIVVDDGTSRAEIRLDSPSRGIYVPPMIWAVQYKFSPDAVLVVLASAEYDANDYIRDYEEFLTLVGDRRDGG